MKRFRLCDLPVGVRIGLIGLVLTLAGGLVASWYYLYLHYSPRDGNDENLTYVDVASAYHKMKIPAPLIGALQRNHPDELVDEKMPAAEREALLEWLGGEPNTIMQDFENEALEEFMPADIIFNRCVSCHDEDPKDTEHGFGELPLYTRAEVQAVAISRDIQVTPERVLAASTHAHALALAIQTILVVGLLLGTRLPRSVVSIASVSLGFGLLLDVGSWWLARDNEFFVYVILGAGGVFNSISALSLGLILVDLVVPKGKGTGDK